MQQPSVRLDDTPSTLQESVYQLEAYKRRLGRNFDRAKNHHDRVYYFNRYNECENCIQMLCDKYRLRRNTQPHKLKLEAI